MTTAKNGVLIGLQLELFYLVGGELTFAGGGINIWCGRESTGGGESFQVWRGERANFWWVGRGSPPNSYADSKP